MSEIVKKYFLAKVSSFNVKIANYCYFGISRLG